MIKFFLKSLLIFALLSLIFAVLTKTLPLPGTIPVLMYHSIGSREDAKERKNFVDRKSFSAQMFFLKIFGYRVISMEEFYRIQTRQQLPRGREVVLTFDDANQTFSQEAWPILRQYGFPVTLFVVSESMKQQINDSLFPEDIQDYLKTGLLTLGSASKTHPDLTLVKDKQREEEIWGSKQDLESMMKSPIHYFSYPYGELDADVLRMVKKVRYRLAFTTSYHKLKGLEENPYALTRLNITRSSDNPIVFWVKISGLFQTHKFYWAKLKRRMTGLFPAR